MKWNSHIEAVPVVPEYMQKHVKQNLQMDNPMNVVHTHSNRILGYAIDPINIDME